ncbi:MAG: apolipoprotein N-acyltransferase, partial [Paracoccaceae bacterium]
GMINWTQPVDDEIKVSMIQGNIAQQEKWLPQLRSVHIQKHLDLMAEHMAEADLVIWPETSLPFSYGSHPQGMALLRDAMNGAQFIGGIQRRDDVLLFNTLMHLDGAGDVAQLYDKQHLVPFGEYVPLADLAAQFGIYGMAAKDGMGFAAGIGPRVIAVDGVPPYVPLICYEAIFPALAQVKGPRPEWLVHITNDAWFGNFSGPYQHLVQAQARAIEQGLPVARAANTGISAMIDPYGRIVQALALNTDGFMDVQLPVAAPVTLYSRYGEWIWIVLAGLALAIVAYGRQPVARLTDKG